MARQPFVWGQGGRKMTPDEVDRQRLVAQALLARGADFSPAGHWTEALGRAFSGWASGRLGNLARQGEEAGMAGAREAITASPVLSALMGGSGVPGAAPSVASIPGGDMAATIRQGLIARGLPEHVADGFLMNFQDESGLDPGINEISPLVPGSRGGFGLYQLTGPRRTAYEAFAAERGVDPADVDAQLDFLMTELQGPEAAAAQSIFSAPDAGSAAAAIARDFLRPAPEHLQRRVSRYTGQPGSSFVQPNQNVVSALMQAQADPWVQKAYGPQLSALMQQQMGMQNAAYEQQLRQQDPMYQAELARMRQPQVSEYDQRAQAAQMFGLTPGTEEFQRFVLAGDLGGDGPASVREYQFYANQALQAGQQPLPYDQWDLARRQSGATQINLGGEGQRMGQVPAGYAAVVDPSNASGFRLEPIPGGPVAQETAAAAEKKALAGQNALTATDIVTSAASRAREANQRRALGGILGQWAAVNPASENAELYRQVDVLKSNAKVENLNAMRASSPTGGALGSVTEKEADMLASKSGALNPASPYFERDLADYELTLLRTVHGYDQGSALFDQMYPEGLAGITGGSKTDNPSDGASADPNVDLLRKYGLQ